MPPMPQPDARLRFLDLLRTSIADGSLVKLTLGKHRGADASLKNIFIRPVTLQAGPRLSFVHRHATRDVTKNHPAPQALALVEKLLGADFLDAHLFTTTKTAQLECAPGAKPRLRIKHVAQPAGSSSTGCQPVSPSSMGCQPMSPSDTGCQPVPPNPPTPPSADSPACATSHDRPRRHPIPSSAPWLRALGVTNARAQVREGMSAKFRQINKFAELLSHLATEAKLIEEPRRMPLKKVEADVPAAFCFSSPAGRSSQAAGTSASTLLHIADMGCGKGYLTFATAALFGARARVQGIETRPDLVDLCNRVAREHNFTNLAFTHGTIATAPLDTANDNANATATATNTTAGAGQGSAPLDILIALHACDTATDDAIARGVAAGARLIIVSPCCHKELRPQLTAPPVLAPALRHGIFHERHAEFVTDALRALLLECAGYRAKVFEFISTEHTAKNLMIAAIKTHETNSADALEKVCVFARFYGIQRQTLATHLGIALA